MVQSFSKYFFYDDDLERAILGIVLLERNVLDLITDILTPEMLYIDKHKIIYSAILEMKKAGIAIDILTAVNYTVNSQKSAYFADNDSIAYYVTRITNDVVNSAHVIQWAQMVKSLFIKREWTKIRAQAGDSIEDMIAAQERINRLTAMGGAMEFSHIDDCLIELYRHMAQVEEQGETGIPTGCHKLDRLNGGYQPGMFIVIGARPSVGKSAFMGKAVLDAAEKGCHVGVISLEMPKAQIAGRLASIVSKIDFWRIYRAKLGEDQEREANHRKLMKLAGRSIYIADKVKVNIFDIRAAAIRMHKAKKLDILYIDYLQLIDTTTGNKNYNREQEVAQLSRGLKVLALELGIPIIALAQLNRDIEKQQTPGGSVKRRLPKLSDLRESGSLEQDADAVLFIHRDYKAGVIADEGGRTTADQADIVVAKWRNGEDTNGTADGAIKMGFDGPKMQFVDVMNWDEYLASGVSGYDDHTTQAANLPRPAAVVALPGNYTRVDLETGELFDDSPF